jgi:hypothetical protein
MTARPSNSPAESAAESTIVADAYRKVMAKETLSRQEQSALKRHEKEKEERLRWQFYAAIPQKHWRKMSGRQTKVINEQAARYGIPFGGATVGLSAVVRALHDFLADNAQKLSREEDELMAGPLSPALERFREERAALARLDRLERERQLLPRDEIRQALARAAGIVRAAGDNLQRDFGDGARGILDEALDDVEREFERSFGPQQNGDTVEQPTNDDAPRAG